MPDSVLLHMRFILRKRNITVLRDSFSRYYGRHLRVSFNDGLYRRVRQGELPEGQEKVPWGTPSAHRAIRLALNKNEKMENALPRGSFSLPPR